MVGQLTDVHLLTPYDLPDVEQRVLPTAELIEALPPGLPSVALAGAGAGAAGGCAVAQLETRK